MTPMPPELNIETLPSRRDEAWKWTDLRGAAKTDQNGLSGVCTPRFEAPEGVYVSQGEGHAGDHPMAKLAAQFSPESWNIYVPPGTNADAPLAIEDISGGHGRIAIMVDKGAQLNMVEHHAASAGSFTNLDMQIHLAEGAVLNRVIVHEDADEALRVVTSCVAMEAGAKITQHSLSFGGGLSRLETRLYGEGAGIEAHIHGAYLLDGKRHTDMTSHIHLKAPDSLIRQSVKGVVSDTARGVFQGKFHVERPAQKTDAEMRHDALMLSDRAQVRAKPELEIYADDVECAHGNTIGALDESALFYMRQRGIPLVKARALLTEAFVAGVFDDLADEALRDSLLGKIREWLETDT